MSLTYTIIAPYLVNGNPATLNVVAVNPVTNPGEFRPNLPGQLGGTFRVGTSEYQLVKMDSGGTAVSAGQVLYWKNKVTKEVTNVVANAVNGATTNAWRNEVAGIAGVAFTPDATNGNYICILLKGVGVTVLATSGIIGDQVTSDVAGGVGKVLTAGALGTAPGYQVIGVVTTAVSGGVVVMDVNLPNLP